MDKIEKIYQEIERLKEFNHNMADNVFNSIMRNFYDGEEDCCKRLLSFIDALPEEYVEGLENDEIIDYAHSKFYYDKDFDGYGHGKFRPVFTREDLISFARHYYKLGLNAKKIE